MKRFLLLFLLLPAAATADLPNAALTAEQVNEDVAILKEALTTLHPGYGRYTSETHMQAFWGRLETQQRDGSDVSTLYTEVSRTLAELRCDHTKAELPKSIADYRKEQPTYLPFHAIVRDGRMFVRFSGDQRLAVGSEILSINGRTAASIIRDILPLIPVDGFTDYVREEAFGRNGEWQGGALDNFLPMLYGESTSFELEVRDTKSVAQTLTLAALTYDDWLKLDSEVGRQYTNFSDDDQVRLSFPQKGVAYLAVDTFVNYRKPVDPDAVYRSIFQEIADKDADTLILDLRRNGGGSSDAANGLLRYVMDRPFRVYREIRVRRIEYGDLRQHMNTWEQAALDPDPAAFDQTDDGWFILKPGVPGMDQGVKTPVADAFDRRLVVLTDNANSSGSTSLLTVIRSRKNTVLVGEPTGGNPDGPTAGIMFFLKLPNSEITVRVPWFLQVSDSVERFYGQGLSPDVRVTTSVEDELNGVDRSLQVALELASR
ncbi:MAG: S41 family peptidase [Woeseiaceae bacterium]|nr:S41 family peptidase [Woeseiaceae bacterium]